MDPDAAIPVRAMTGQDSLESAFWRKRLAADDWEREAERFSSAACWSCEEHGP